MSAQLRITGVSRTTLDHDGGEFVVIRGEGFLAQIRHATVYFGRRQGTFVRFASNEELIVQAPGGTPGEQVDLTLAFEPGGTITLPKAFTYVNKP